MQAGKSRKVHKARGSGRWFPGNQQQLSEMIDQYVEAARTSEPGKGKIVGAIVPHAGYVYSGPVAGYTFRAIRNSVEKEKPPETVVILGFSHRTGFQGAALLDGDAMETPLGDAALDTEAARALAASSPRLFLDSAPHVGEHSAENQVPFVQRVLPASQLVIVIIGDHEEETRRDLVRGLEDLAGRKNILVLASTDLLHDADYEKVTRTDKTTLSRITALQHQELAQSWSYAHQVCCGISTVLTVMQFAEARGCREGVLLHYRNSGDDYPESRGQFVVGYGAVLFKKNI